MPTILIALLILAGTGLALSRRRRVPAVAPPAGPPREERRPAPTRDVAPGVEGWIVLPPDPGLPREHPDFGQTIRAPLKKSTEPPFDMPTEMELDSATRLAQELEPQLLREMWGPAYLSKKPALAERVRQFQALMNLVVDGKYGPRVAGAFLYLLRRPPPAPWFAEPRTVVIYEPIGSGVRA